MIIIVVIIGNTLEDLLMGTTLRYWTEWIKSDIHIQEDEIDQINSRILFSFPHRQTCQVLLRWDCKNGAPVAPADDEVLLLLAVTVAMRWWGWCWLCRFCCCCWWAAWANNCWKVFGFKWWYTGTYLFSLFSLTKTSWPRPVESRYLSTATVFIP